jgi:hypothetical protein
MLKLLVLCQRSGRLISLDNSVLALSEFASEKFDVTVYNYILGQVMCCRFSNTYEDFPSLFTWRGVWSVSHPVWIIAMWC